MPERAGIQHAAISFGPFRLFPEQRILLEGERPVRLGSRSLLLLIALAEQPGRVVGKAELIARVWRGVKVDEINLRVSLAALRRAIGDGSGGSRYIVTVPGRG